MCATSSELVRRAATGDGDAWNSLVESLSGLLWAVGRSHGLGDVATMEVARATWMQLLSNLDQIEEPDRIQAWLVATARRECQAMLDTATNPVIPVAEQADDVVARAYAMLPTQDRLLLVLLASEPAMCDTELSQALDLPTGAVEPMRLRCLARLRLLADNIDNESSAP